MAKVITLKLTGLAEKFMAEMERQGLNEADVIAQGIGILEEVWRTRRVALVKNGFFDNAQTFAADGDDRIIEHYFHIQTPASMGIQSNQTR